MSYNGLTNRGLEYLAKCQAESKPITLTKVKIGSGYISSNQTGETTTDLYKFEKETGILSSKQEKNRLKLEIQIDNFDVNEGFYVKEFGVFAQDGNQEILYWYINRDRPSPMPDKSEPTTQTYFLGMEVSQAETVIIEYTGGELIASKEYVDGAVEEIKNELKTKQNDTDETLKTTSKKIVEAINEVKDLADEKEPKITNKKTGFNLDKSDNINLDNSETLATSKAVKTVADMISQGAEFKGEYNQGAEYKAGDIVYMTGHEPCLVFETINPEMSDPKSIKMFKKVYRIKDKMFYKYQENKTWEIIFDGEENIPFYTITQKGTEQEYFSTVDNYYPYSKIGRVLLRDGVEQYECDFNDSTKKKGGGSSVLTGTDGDVMVRIPKFYSDVKFVPQGIRYRIFTYENPAKKVALGIKPHPYFLKPDGKTYYDVRYQGAYKASLKDGVLRSISGVSPLVSRTMANFIDYAQQGRTNDYSIGNYLWVCVKFLLYIIEFGSLNSQELFGQGRSNTSSLSATGSTNGLGNRSGRLSTDDANGNVSYRGFEDVWGNIWEFDTGFFITNDGYYITNDPANYMNKAKMTHYPMKLITKKSENFISEIEKILGAEHLVLPKTTTGTANTYYCDKLWTHDIGEENISLSGGNWDDGAFCGVLCLAWDHVASNAYSHIGARLSYARK